MTTIKEKIPSSPAYQNLMQLHKNTGRLEAIAEIISRDFLTAMPEGAYSNRVDQISYLQRRIHEDLISKQAQAQLEEAQEHYAAHPQMWGKWHVANLNGMENVYKKQAILSTDLMETSALIANEGRKLHQDILKSGDWSEAEKHLTRVVDHTKRLAERKAKWRNSATLYEALIQDHSPGFDLKTIWEWFNHLDRELSKLYPKIMERQKRRPDIIPLNGPFDKEAQMLLNRSLIGLFGFDFKRGALYETGHSPVEGGTPDDARLVIKNVDDRNFMDSMKSALHEGGHGLYLQNLPAKKKWAYQPVALDLGTTIHESQALFIEMIIGRTPAFFEFLAPRLEGLFHKFNDPALTAENLYRIKTEVKPTLHRRSADEVTYFFHVFLRFQIECDLIEGIIKVTDIPAYWTEWMHKKLGIMPQNHAEGVLQDVHWFVGKFGYFQSYSLGHMIAAQLYDKMGEDIPRLQGEIQDGDFHSISSWLTSNIHKSGSLYDTETLLKKATGSAPSPDFLLSHLEQRYLTD